MKKTPGPVGFTGEFYQTLLEEIIFLHKPFWNIEEWEIFRSWTIFWFRCCPSHPYLWIEERQQPPHWAPATHWVRAGPGRSWSQKPSVFLGWGRFLGRNVALSMPHVPSVAARLMSVLAPKLGVCMGSITASTAEIVSLISAWLIIIWTEDLEGRNSTLEVKLGWRSRRFGSACEQEVRTQRKKCCPVKLAGVIYLTGSSRPGWKMDACLCMVESSTDPVLPALRR